MANLEFYWIHRYVVREELLLIDWVPFYVSVDAWASLSHVTEVYVRQALVPLIY
jgi:hypothetical protein